MKALPQLIAANEKAAKEQRVCTCAGRSIMLSTGVAAARDALAQTLRVQDEAWEKFDWSYGRSDSSRNQSGSTSAVMTTTMEALPM